MIDVKIFILCNIRLEYEILNDTVKILMIDNQ